MVNRPFIIAVDGPAASGKGTLARRLASHFGLKHLDTGLLYRAVAYKVLSQDGDLEDEALALKAVKSLDEDTLALPELRTPDIGTAASIIAKNQAVRQALLDFQRAFANEGAGAVLDGRDIGTVICPNAPVKIFVTADLKERARRRFLEMSPSDTTLTLAKVETSLAQRDARDIGRKDAPMVQAEDAHLLNTTKLDIEEAVELAIELVTKAQA